VIAFLAPLLGFGGLGLKLLLWLGGKVVSGAMVATQRTKVDGENAWRFLSLSAKRKTPEVALEMAHHQAQTQGSMASPVRLILTLMIALVVWGGMGWWLKIPYLKAKLADAERECAGFQDTRELCKQFYQQIEANAKLEAQVRETQEQVKRTAAGYEGKLQLMAQNRLMETERLRRSIERQRKANNVAASAGAEKLTPDDYRAIVRGLFEPASVPAEPDAGASADSGSDHLAR